MKNSFIFLFFAISTLFVTAQNPKTITVENIWQDYLFYPARVQGFTPMPKSNDYTVVKRAGIERHAFLNGDKIGLILDNSVLSELSNQKLNISLVDDYSFDNDEKQILLATELESIYRRSSKAYYYVYNVENKTLISVSDTLLGKQSYATFSPDGKKVAFVRHNNIFVKDLLTNQEQQITTDGSVNSILNGMADWVYEEELEMKQSFYWSPDNSKIAYLKFDESAVKEYTITQWGDLYPTEYKYKYPKAGEDNSQVSVHIFDLVSNKDAKIEIPDNADCYFPRLYWLSNGTDLIILKLNRHQNRLDFIRLNTITNDQQIVFTDENDCWLEITDDYYFLKDNNSLITTSERNGYNHIYYVNFNGKIEPITQGNMEVANICYVNEEEKLIYYTSNESHTLNRDLYVVDFKGKNKKMLTSGDGWNSVEFNPTGSYYLNNYSNLNTPPKYTIHNSKGKELRVLSDNKGLIEKTLEYGFEKTEFFSFTTSDSIQLNGWMLKPSFFNPKKSYPVLMYVYGGPGSQEVKNAYSRGMDYAWYQLLAQHGYIIVCVDGRGTAGRGDAFKKCVYKQMGKYEAIDQIATANYLKTLPYVDSERIGIWGWSFGGYLSSLAHFKNPKTFKMAIAVAPVTNWRYYDNIYTERFLQTPQENAAGYDDNSPITYADQLNGYYLVVHGTADDNVHFQNAVDLFTALNSANKQYDQFLYPNKNHFIMGGNTRCHLYNKLTNYILEHL